MKKILLALVIFLPALSAQFVGEVPGDDNGAGHSRFWRYYNPHPSSFIGSRDSRSNKEVPKPLSEAEVYDLLNEGPRATGEAAPAGKRSAPEIRFTVGEHVKVIDGPFNNFSGVVEEVFPEKGRVRVKVEIFGRGTPVELDYLQVGRL